MKFHFEALNEKTNVIFYLLSRQSFIKKFYLAGGSGLALQIGHRISVDLDFFSQENFDESFLVQQLSKLDKFTLSEKAPQTIIGFIDEVKISFFGYGYTKLKPFKNIENINIADILDIACMKIDAISSRGTKRDFIDVYFVAKEFVLFSEILKMFEKKYSAVNYNMMHIKKSLVYFEDAEKDPMPQMLKSADWTDIKNFFKKEILK